MLFFSHTQGVSNLLIKIVAAELNCRIRNDSNAVCAIPSHEASPSFFLPHLHETFPNGKLILLTPRTLYLEEDLESFKGRDNRSRYSSRYASSTEGRNHRLSNQLPELVYFRSILRFQDVVPRLSHASVRLSHALADQQNSRQTFPTGIESLKPEAGSSTRVQNRAHASEQHPLAR